MGKDLLRFGELSPELFTELLNSPSTYRVAYQKGHLCPCKTVRGGQDTKCPICKGTGYYWTTPPVTRMVTETKARGSLHGEKLGHPPAGPVAVTTESGISIPSGNIHVDADGKITFTGSTQPAVNELYTITYPVGSIRAAITGVATRRDFQQAGELELSDISVTVDRYLEDKQTLNPLWDAGEHDRITLLDTYRRHTQHVKRGQDTTTYRHLKDVSITSRHPTNFTLIEYQAGVDFTFNDGVITWLTLGPPVDSFYTVEAQASPEYYVFEELPQTRHMDGQKMPRHFMARLFEKWPNRKA